MGLILQLKVYSVFLVVCLLCSASRSGGGAERWQERMVESSASTVEQAVEWVGGAGGKSTVTSLVEAVHLALADREVSDSPIPGDFHRPSLCSHGESSVSPSQG